MLRELREVLKGNMRTLALVAALSGAYSAMLDVVVQPMMLDIGASVALIGLLFSLGGFSGIIPTLVQPVAGALSDLHGRKSILLIARVLLLSAILCYLASAFTRSLALASLAVILGGLSAMGWPVWDATVADATPGSYRGMAYSLILVSSAAPGLFTRPAGGLAADELGYWTIFSIAAVAESLCLLALWRGLSDERQNARVNISLSSMLKRAFKPPKGLRVFYLLNGLDSLTWGTTMGIINALMVSHFGLRNFQIGLLSTALSVTMVASQVPIGALIDRVGCRLVLVVSQLLGVPFTLLILLGGQFWQLILAYSALGLAAATWFPATRAYLSKAAPSGDVGGSLGRLSVFNGLIGFPAPALGGVLYEHLGLIGPLTPTLLGSLMLALGFIVLLQKE